MTLQFYLCICYWVVLQYQVKDSAEIVNSLLQWNSTVISTYNNSSRQNRMSFSSHTQSLHFNILAFIRRIVASFESILLQYAQQIIPNTSDTFKMPLLTIRAENVSIHSMLIIRCTQKCCIALQYLLAAILCAGGY